MPQQSRSRGVCILGWTVITANTLLYFVYYFQWHQLASEFFQHAISFVAMAAVFPYDLFTTFFSSQWLPQIIWVMMVVVCAFGILLLNKFARAIFIILNILHVVVLGYLVAAGWGKPDFLEAAFRLYFTAVVSGSYMAFLTLSEIREQFKVALEGLRLEIFLKRPLGKTVRSTDADKYAGLSTAYARLERYDDAVDALQKAIQGQPQRADYFFRLGMLYIKQRNFGGAITALQDAIRKDPAHYEAYYNLGVLYVQQGCSAEAAGMFLKATHVRPKESQAYRDLGDAYFAMGEYLQAVEQFKKATALSRGDGYSYYRMGCILSEYLGKDQEGLEALRACLRVQRDFIDAYFQFGKVCLKLKRYKDAVRAFKEVVRAEPDQVQAQYHLGFSYLMLKDIASARRQCELLRRQDEDLANNLLLLFPQGGIS